MMNVREAITFLNASFTMSKADRVKGEDYSHLDRMEKAVNVLNKRIIELENENGKLKLERMVR